MEVNVDVSYDGSRSLSELMNKSKPGSNGSNNNANLIFLFLKSSCFHLLIKQKPDVRVNIIPLAIVFFVGSYVKNLQHPTPHHETTMFAADRTFLPLNWSINLDPYILLICTHNQFFCQFHSLCIVILTRVIDYYYYFQVI